MNDRCIFLKSSRLWIAVAILCMLAGCRSRVTVTSPAPTVMRNPTPSPTLEEELREDGLTPEEAATLSSLDKVDDHPLYTMHYQGDYDSLRFTHLGEMQLKALNPENPEVWTLPWACSLFAALGGTPDRLFGRNFDWRFSPALLLFTDPADGYAAVSIVDIEYLGFGGEGAKGLLDLSLSERIALLEAPYIPFDGMNETGLVVGMAAVPPGSMTPDPTKETVDSLPVMRMILDQAASVEEAVAILERYNIDMGGGPPLHYLIADPSGRSVVVEFYQGEMVLIPNSEPWQVATNFLRSSVDPYPPGMCWRYDRISQHLQETGGKLNAREAMELLSDVSQESTQWSVVYEMSRGEVNVTMGRKYGQVHTFSVHVVDE